MKLLVLAAFIAVVSSGRLSDQLPENQQQWPWQSGKQYNYEVTSHTLARLQEGASSGNAFKAQFIVRVKSPGRLQAKLENPQHAQFHQLLANNMALPSGLQYKPAQNLDKPFEISVEGGRVVGISLPSSLPVTTENLLKGLISALQVDLSTHGQVSSPQASYDKERQQGLFTKIETDVTGDCETLYSVSPVASEWRRELPQWASEEDPMEITKSRNYGHCHHRVAYHFGVPMGAEWTGTAHSHNEKQFITHGSVSRILAGKQGPIYKAETTSNVYVHPHVYGKQKAEVHSYLNLNLLSVEVDNGVEWQKPEGTRQIKTLLYAMTTKQMAIHDSSNSMSSESHEHINVQFGQNQNVRAGQQQSNEEQSNWPGYQQLYGSSSSSDSSSAYINDEVPKINEPAYAALYLNSQTRGDKKQNPMNAQKLLLDLAQQLQNPNNMPKAEFLTKFNILVRLVASMSTDQLAQISRSIEVGKASDNIVKADMWMIFRDAVVQAGTPPAFQQIRTWIKSKKIQTEEAAEVITSLARTLRYPTKEIMVQFFELAMSPEVREQELLGTSALMAATRFIRMGQVNNVTAQSYYPTQMYGRLARKNDRFVVDEILPRLSQELKQAVQNNERSVADIYIRAIGNLGHPEILRVFAPYLEGQIPASTYLRVQIVAELKSLVDLNNKYARAVLYSILRNTAEPYEVRVAAALNLFRANPTTDMMQAMAQMTHKDPSIHVRTILKTGILSAATLKDPRHWHLAKSAQAVKDMVTSEYLGISYSTEMLYDVWESNEQDDYFREISFISSEDGAYLPKRYRTTWSKKISGWAAEDMIEFAFSSAQEVADYIKQMIYQQPLKSNANHKYSAQKVSEMLNIKQDPQNPLQSSFHIDILGQERFFAFDEKDYRQLVKEVMDYLTKVEQGVERHYTKVFNSRQISVMFPIATGVPFIYKYKEPIVIHIQSKVNGKFDYKNKNFKDMTSTVDTEIQLTFARNIDGSVGFMDTLSNQLASAGVVKKYQVYVPINVNMEIKYGEYKMKVQPLRPDQDTTLLHYSVWPYSAMQKKDSLTPIAQDPTTKLVERPRKVLSTDYKFGQPTGTVFQVQGYSYSKNFRNVGNFFQALYNINELLAPSDIALTHYNIRYLAKQSKNKAVSVTLVHDKLYNQKQGGELALEKQDNAMPESGVRREQIVKVVAAGINTAQVELVDLSASFEGQLKQDYVITAAFAASPVDSKVQGALSLRRTTPQVGYEQISAVGKMVKPQTSPVNFLEALQNNMMTTFEGQVRFEQNGNIFMKGNSERSQLYTEQLKNHPWAKQCQQEIAGDGLLQPAESCQMMLIMAHAPDTVKVSVNYKNLTPVTMNVTAQALRILKNMKGYIDTNPMKRLPDGKLELQAEASYIDNTLRFEMASSGGVLRIDNMPIPKYSPFITSTYSIFSPLQNYEHLGNWASNFQYRPFCAVGVQSVKTFSNRVYNYELSSSWHVVMREEQLLKQGKWDELVILARRPAAQQQEIYISYKSETGKDLEIEIPSSAVQNKGNVKVKTNSQKITDGDLTMYWDNESETPLLQYFIHPDGLLMLSIRDERIRIMFNGERLGVSTGEYRKTTRGICGRNSGEPRDDYQTPNGLVDQPQLYGASFALSGENSDPKTEELKKQAQQMAYQPKTTYTAILRSDAEWQQAVQKAEQQWGSLKVYRTRNYLKQRGQCQLQQQVQYHETHGEICITTTPLPSCQSHCRGEGYQVRAAQVICRSKNDGQFRTLRNQIQQGQNPEVSGVPTVEQYRVPSSCRA